MNLYDTGMGRTVAPSGIGYSAPEGAACGNRDACLLCQSRGIGAADMPLFKRVAKRYQVYRRGEVLFRAGDPVEFVYAVRSGSVKTSISTDDGRVQVTGFHAPGDLLGLSALCSREYTGEARALETTSMCKVTAESFEELAEKMPAIRSEVMRLMSNQIRRDESLMLLLGKRSAEERLAAYLLGLSRRFATRCYSATQFNLTMSRGDIGNYLGIAEETVCRVLARFHAEGCIENRRRQVVLRDCVRLAEIAAGPRGTAASMAQ
jgi:CRP/FNR family transcriptional regulator